MRKWAFFLSFCFSASSAFALLNGQFVNARQNAAERSLVFLTHTGHDGKPFFLCSASLIAPGVVLTAAHCLDHKIQESLGDVQVVFSNTFSFDPNKVIRNATRTVIHPDYNTSPIESFKWVQDKQSNQWVQKPDLVSQFDHDVALVFFEGRIPTGFQTIRIDEDRNRVLAGKKVLLYGYGYNSDPALSLNPILAPRALQRGRAVVELSIDNQSDLYWTKKDSTHSLCTGDSGGPQVLVENNIPRIVGVNSCSGGEYIEKTKKISCKGRSRFARVSFFADWIKKEMEKSR